ncbi:hypothetical protein N5D67_15520 [Comamonas aquatica]|uniref:hypothetical protein n=1 Tax=Comamonas aquatica TaxID=225991 RepID=UPI00244ACBED|nr:hypothetical protein [Comamonas aquatica]MDH1903708.1 hypothetical protein [Comamonas aquatica]
MSTPPYTEFCSLPGQEDQSARLAASAEVGQVVDTPTLEQFQRWLETKAHAAFQKVSGSSRYYPTPEELGNALVVAECRAATKLLMQFKLEQSA